METTKTENINIEKNKELFEYEMTEVLLKLKGEFAAVSGRKLIDPETDVDNEKLVVNVKDIPEVELTGNKTDIPEIKEMVLPGLDAENALKKDPEGLKLSAEIAEAFNDISINLPDSILVDSGGPESGSAIKEIDFPEVKAPVISFQFDIAGTKESADSESDVKAPVIPKMPLNLNISISTDVMKAIGAANSKNDTPSLSDLVIGSAPENPGEGVIKAFGGLSRDVAVSVPDIAVNQDIGKMKFDFSNVKVSGVNISETNQPDIGKLSFELTMPISGKDNVHVDMPADVSDFNENVGVMKNIQTKKIDFGMSDDELKNLAGPISEKIADKISADENAASKIKIDVPNAEMNVNVDGVAQDAESASVSLKVDSLNVEVPSISISEPGKVTVDGNADMAKELWNIDTSIPTIELNVEALAENEAAPTEIVDTALPDVSTYWDDIMSKVAKEKAGKQA